MIEVRRAKIGDGPFLMTTTTELGRSHGWADSMTATAAKLEAALFDVDPVIGACIALVEGQAAGSAIWHRSFSTRVGAEIMYLEDLVVLADFRRRGVAEALMKFVAKQAITAGYQKIFWLMMEWNSGARQFYEGIGAEIENGNCYCSLSGHALTEFAA
jgi:GNAT superfamily N-acetyltransferase